MAIGSPQWMYSSGEDAFTIDQSLRFNDDNSYLSWTPSSTGTRDQWTWSGWIKLCGASIGTKTVFQGASDSIINFEGGGGQLRHSATSEETSLVSNAVYRDPSAWMHICVVWDTAQVTASDRLTTYVNGSEITFTGSSYPAQDRMCDVGYTGYNHYLGTISGSSGGLDGYMAEVHFIDGAAVNPTSFGEFGDYGEFKPKKYSGSYGTLGFYLDFADSADLGKDVSGNGNDWTATNLTASDQVLDTPTNNFCTLNPLDVQTDDKMKEGNLFAMEGMDRSRGTMAVSSGKWYFEVWLKYHHHGAVAMGIREVGGNAIIDNDTNANLVTIQHPIGSGTRWDMVTDGTATNGSEVGTMNNDDIIGIAFNVDDEEISFTRNGSAIHADLTDFDWSGLNNMSQVAPTVVSPGGREAVVNFGQDSSFAGGKTAQGNQDSNEIGDFFYEPPNGFLALCTKNLPDVDVVPSEHFNTVLYTGTDDTGSGHSITGVGFEPSLVWTKDRDAAYGHYLFDAVRGTGVTKGLRSNTTADEGMANESYDALSSFDSDGFTITGTAFGSLYQDRSSADYVAWNWKANGSGSSNTDGTINTTATSANVDSGFSISTYSGNNTSGATVGHGLSKAPELILIKKRSAAAAWGVYNKTDGNTKVSHLDLTAPSYASSGIWNNTTPGASVFTLGNNALVNSASTTYVAYCFHSVDGYSKVGSYTGNNNVDGTFVYTGFRPAFILYKATDNYTHWAIHNTESNPYNVADTELHANETAAEASAAEYKIDFLSNGFKQRNTNGTNNGNGYNYIYIAFASVPFKFGNAR
jgi:hypothetical protein